jgi:alkyl sulfatase BDS1-like metallo-beta-lactamase superfamily hydrolase
MPELARMRAELRALDTSDFTNAQKGLLGESRASLVVEADPKLTHFSG